MTTDLRQSVEDEAAMIERDKLLVEEMSEIWKLAVPSDEARLTERVVRLKTLLHLNVTRSLNKILSHSTYCMYVRFICRPLQKERSENFVFASWTTLLYFLDSVTWNLWKVLI